MSTYRGKLNESATIWLFEQLIYYRSLAYTGLHDYTMQCKNTRSLYYSVLSFTQKYFYNVFLMFRCYSLGLLEIKMESIDKRNKHPPLALENLISAPGTNSNIHSIPKIKTRTIKLDCIITLLLNSCFPWRMCLKAYLHGTTLSPATSLRQE